MSIEIIKSPDFYLNLKKSQFKTPIEIIKKNFKNLQKLIEKNNLTFNKQIKNLYKLNNNKVEKLKLLNKLIQQQESFNKKLSVRVKQHNEFIERLIIRIKKFEQIKKLHTDFKNNKDSLLPEIEEFYREEINLLIIDYLLRNSNSNSNSTASSISTNSKLNPGIILAKSLKLDKLIDYDVILQGLKIYTEIRYNKNLNLLISWCTENKKNLKIIRENNNNLINENLEFETHFQEFIEKIKSNEIYNALEIAKKYLIGNSNVDLNLNSTLNKKDFEKITKGAALTWSYLIKKNNILLFNNKENQTENNENISAMDFYDISKRNQFQIKQNFRPYQNLLDSKKWTELAEFFFLNFKLLYGINQTSPLINMLSIGGSTLKTRSCNHTFKNNAIDYEEYINNSNGNQQLINDCPICSTDLFELCSRLPFSHQVKSNIYENPVMLPNGNIYQFEKLISLNKDSLNGAINERLQDFPVKLKIGKEDDEPVIENEEEINTINFIGLEDIQRLEGYKIKDPLTCDEFEMENIVKVFPT